jgi:hypothetical protein
MLGSPLVAHVRRLSTAGTTLYIRIGNSDVSRLGLAHGQAVEIDLRGVRIDGVVKTSGGSPWLAPGHRGSNAAITSALRGAGLDHGMDIHATLRPLGGSSVQSVPATAPRNHPPSARAQKPAWRSPLPARMLRGQELWDRIKTELGRLRAPWRDRIAAFGQVSAVEERQNGGEWKNSEIFEGIVLGVLSNSIDWAKIEAVRPKLGDVFLGFEPAEYARIGDDEVRRILAWFGENNAALPYTNLCSP